MNEFEKSEQAGRQKAKMLFSNYQLVESSDIYTVWDFSGRTTHMAADAANYFIEVKNRDVKSTSYETSLLEVDKFTSLKTVADANGKANIFYLCFYTDGVAFCYNLRKINLADVLIFSMNCAHKTAVDVGKKDKMFIELPHSLAKRYKINNLL